MKKNLREQIEQYGNKNSRYKPLEREREREIFYPMTSQDFVRTGFMTICPTLAARDYKDPKQTFERENGMIKVRKLTPRECGRLMGVTDEDITAILSVNSNSQAYKQFGNSIVVDVLAAMYKNIFIENKNDLSVEEILQKLREG